MVFLPPSSKISCVPLANFIVPWNVCAVLKQFSRVSWTPLPSISTGPVSMAPNAHWAISMWWAPQSVSLPPEYSYHQRNEP